MRIQHKQIIGLAFILVMLQSKSLLSLPQEDDISPENRLRRPEKLEVVEIKRRARFVPIGAGARTRTKSSSAIRHVCSFLFL